MFFGKKLKIPQSMMNATKEINILGLSEGSKANERTIFRLAQKWSLTFC